MKDSHFELPSRRALFVFLLAAFCPLLHGAPAPSWSSGPDLPTNLIRATGVYFPANGRFYAMGGRANDAFGSEMTTPYEYNPKTNTWAFKTAPFPDNQVCNMACGVLSVGRTPYIYCVSGTTGGNATTSTNRVFRYDPMADRIDTFGIQAWTESTPNTLPSGFAVVENKLYILGGFTIAKEVTNRIFEFTPENPDGSQWAQKAATLPVALAYIPATAIGNLIFTAGGSTFAPCNLTETTHSFVYDPVKDSVSSLANIPRAAGETQAVSVANEMWVVAGGRTAPNPSSEVNIYNPSTGQWRLGSPLSAGQRNFAVASDGSRVFVAGGYDSSTVPLNKARTYGDTQSSVR
jgi:N-acetylneuraminic acid mutarotase